MGKSKKNRMQTENPEPLAFRPFEALLPFREEERNLSGSSETEAFSKEVLPENYRGSLKLKGTFSLRKEKKGRGGKTVTLVSGNCLSPEDAEELARVMRKALGCGSRTEGSAVLLQGDLRERAESWLVAHGAKRVVVG